MSKGLSITFIQNINALEAEISSFVSFMESDECDVKSFAIRWNRICNISLGLKTQLNDLYKMAADMNFAEVEGTEVSEKSAVNLVNDLLYNVFNYCLLKILATKAAPTIQSDILSLINEPQGASAKKAGNKNTSLNEDIMISLVAFQAVLDNSPDTGSDD